VGLHDRIIRLESMKTGFGEPTQRVTAQHKVMLVCVPVCVSVCVCV